MAPLSTDNIKAVPIADENARKVARRAVLTAHKLSTDNCVQALSIDKAPLSTDNTKAVPVADGNTRKVARLCTDCS